MDDGTVAEVVGKRLGWREKAVEEGMRRLVGGGGSLRLGYGGVSIVAAATGVSRRAIHEGIKELRDPAWLSSDRVRRPGGGRKKTVDKDETLKSDLELLVDPVTRGEPESPLRWTRKSVRKLAEELKGQGHETSHRMVAELLTEMGYSLQANQKTLEGASHPDRNAQFEFINRQVQRRLGLQEPVISVDTKKKELVGAFKNGGRELQPQGKPEKVGVHDFADPELGRATPYGVYDMGRNVGWVNVGVDHDTAEFAVQSIRQWWKLMGKRAYPEAKRLLITADSVARNGPPLPLWKGGVQKFGGETGRSVTVCHLPPGESKWKKIEHRLLSVLSPNRAG